MTANPSSFSEDRGPGKKGLSLLRRIALRVRAARTTAMGRLRRIKSDRRRSPKLPSLVVRVIARLRSTVTVFGEGTARLKRGLPETRLGGSAPVRLVARVIKELGEDDATHMAASVSYYAVLSLFPLILGLSAIIGWAAGSSSSQDKIVDFIVGFIPASEEFVRDSLQGIVRFRTALGIVSIFGLLWTASAVFGSITRVVNRAWDVQNNPPFYKNKPRQLAMALGVSVLFAVSVGVTGFLQWATSIEVGNRTVAELLGGTVVTVLLKMPAYLISFAIFLAIYKYIPNTKTYWRDIWLGAAIAAVLFEVGKNIFLWYLENFAQYGQLYGNVASVIILMIWTYVAAFILILGAEFASEYGRMKRGIRRGQRIDESVEEKGPR